MHCSPKRKLPVVVRTVAIVASIRMRTRRIIVNVRTNLSFYITVTATDVLRKNFINPALRYFGIQIVDFTSISVQNETFSVKRWFVSPHDNHLPSTDQAPARACE